MVLCTAGSKRAEFSQAEKIMYQSHCPSLFLWCSSSGMASPTNSRLMGPSTCFFLLAFPSRLALEPATIGFILFPSIDTQWLLDSEPHSGPLSVSQIPKENVCPWLYCDNTLSEPWLGLPGIFLTSPWAWPPLSQPLPREKRCWQDTKRTTHTEKKEEGNRAKETLHSFHLLPHG